MSEPLALRYRPRTFHDMVGQKPTRAVLAKMVMDEALPPSMIFAGVRGTGKTSAARITARAINCEDKQDRFEPCGVCARCVSVGAPWIVEVDAATYGGAERLRELVEDTMYSAGETWKVYVLDEVHAVSSQGFQVLLKTLEEPPPRTSFILVTTEPDKIPETIQARSMLFRFSKIKGFEIIERLIEIAGKEKIELSREAAGWIAEAADGGLRDALMMMDQASRLGEVTVDRITKLFGIRSPAAWIEALLSGNAAEAVIVADEMVGVYGDVGTLVDHAISFMRDVLVAKALSNPMTDDQLRVASRMSQDAIVKMVTQLWTLRVEVGKYGVQDKAALMALSAELVRHPVVEPQETAAMPEEAVMALLKEN